MVYQKGTNNLHWLSPLFLYPVLHFFLGSVETKVCSPESTHTAFSKMTMPTTTFVNGVSPNPPSSEDPLSPKSSPPTREPLAQTENPECQPPPLTRAPTHQLLSIHHTLFEEEEDAENRRDRLAERPGELIAAGECWRRRRKGITTKISFPNTTLCTHDQFVNHLLSSVTFTI